MKSELIGKKRKKTNRPWEINESKCLSKNEVKKLIAFCSKLKSFGLQNKKFSPIRNWFMIELGLNAGLRVQEMADLNGARLTSM